MQSTKALVKEKAEEGYELKDVPIPQLESDEILFKVEKVAICGSDIPLYVWNEVAKVIGKIPFIPGHEGINQLNDYMYKDSIERELIMFFFI